MLRLMSRLRSPAAAGLRRRTGGEGSTGYCDTLLWRQMLHGAFRRSFDGRSFELPRTTITELTDPSLSTLPLTQVQMISQAPPSLTTKTSRLLPKPPQTATGLELKLDKNNGTELQLAGRHLIRTPDLLPLVASFASGFIVDRTAPRRQHRQSPLPALPPVGFRRTAPPDCSMSPPVVWRSRGRVMMASCISPSSREILLSRHLGSDRAAVAHQSLQPSWRRQ